MQYAKWSAVFFAVKNKDQEMAKFLCTHNAKMDVKDEVPIYTKRAILSSVQSHLLANSYFSMATLHLASPGV